jgi:hypothetical protein
MRLRGASVEGRVNGARLEGNPGRRRHDCRRGTLKRAPQALAQAFVLLVVLNAGTALADPRYMIDYVLPRGGTRGATVDLEFHGFSLEKPKEILFYEPGISTAGEFRPYQKPGDGFKVKVQIAPDCPIGEHVLRVRTATGLTDAVTFWVSRFPTIYEFEDQAGQNDTIAKAKPIPPNSTVEGQILPGPDADIDMYRVDVKEGQRVSVEVESARLGTLHQGGENDLMVRILDASGKELGRNDDSALFVQDPMLSIVAPKAGSYYIEIKQQIYFPPRQAWYRAHIGTFSRPTAIFPAGGQAGTTINARILGDPAGERTAQIALPAKGDHYEYFGDAPSPNVLRVSPYPNVEYPANPASLPVALNGILSKPGEAHQYKFQAKKGDAWMVRVYSRSLGAPVDPKLWISLGTRRVVEGDDARLTDIGLPSARASWYIKDQQDPAIVFRPGADGEYTLGVEDTTGAGGPDHVYRVEISPLHDAIYTHITAPEGYQMPRLAGLIIPKGGRWTVDVQLSQGLGNTYKGELELEARGLPKGVTMIAPRVPKGAARVPVQFAAAPDAQEQAALIEILARPVEKGAALETGSRQGFAFINRGGELPWHFVFENKYALAVTEPAPYKLNVSPPAVPLMQGSELLLNVKVERAAGFTGPIEIQPDWLPPGVSKESTVTIPAGKSEATFRIQANDKAAPGLYKIAMSGSTTDGDGYSGIGRVRVSSEFVELRTAQPYLSIELMRSSVERGKRGELVGTLKVARPFPGKATVKLQQLPRGVKMLEPAPTITAADKEIAFHIEADPDALVGLYKGITCEVEFKEEGQTVHSHTGSGILRIDVARSSL